MMIFQRFLTALGRTYQAMQQWEEAQEALEEAEAIAERLDLGPVRVSTLSPLCMHHALAGEWEAALRYALQAIAIRKNADATLIVLDFCSHYETEALLYGGDERQAREAVHRLGERLGPNRRFRVPYLGSRYFSLPKSPLRRQRALGQGERSRQPCCLAAEEAIF